MGRPPKKGLDYYPKDVDFYGDYKIEDLLYEYGPLGVTIYEVILTIVYREGYYLEIPLDKLVLKIVKTIGNKWIKDKNFVLQVIQYCADIGLLCNDLLLQSVVTSVGIQKRYNEVTARNKVKKDMYWLLDKEESVQPLLNSPKNIVSATETQVNVTETQVNVAESAQTKEKKTKVNKSKVNQSNYADAYGDLIINFTKNKDLQQCLVDFIEFRKNDTPASVKAMLSKLSNISKGESDMVNIINNSLANGWKTLVPTDKPTMEKDNYIKGNENYDDNYLFGE